MVLSLYLLAHRLLQDFLHSKTEHHYGVLQWYAKDILLQNAVQKGDHYGIKGI